MNADPHAQHPVRARGGMLLLFLLFLALTLAVINGAQWFVLSRATASLEEELGLRLVTVAGTAASIVSPWLPLDDTARTVVRDQLREVAERNDLSDVFLTDSEGVVLFHIDEIGLDEVYPFLDLDARAFQGAVHGRATASELLERGGAILKAAYAPVRDEVDGSVVAVLGVTAGTLFHESLPALRRTAWAVSIGSAALVALLALLFFGMLRRLSTAEAALARAETLTAMGLMAAGVAHEIRNPLAIITGTAQRLRRKLGPDTGADELLDFIPEEVERLNGILEGYLRFARDEPLAFQDCHVAELVERCCETIREEFAGRGVDVETDVVGAGVLRADPLRLRQVLLNLLLNSAQAMPEGGKITVDVERTESRLRLRVADTGSGLGSKVLRGAFQPFFTTKETGSGLGLAVAKRIVEAHGGTITLANREGGGAVAVLQLPLDGPSGAPRAEE